MDETSGGGAAQLARHHVFRCTFALRRAFRGGLICCPLQKLSVEGREAGALVTSASPQAIGRATFIQPRAAQTMGLDAALAPRLGRGGEPRTCQAPAGRVRQHPWSHAR